MSQKSYITSYIYYSITIPSVRNPLVMIVGFTNMQSTTFTIHFTPRDFISLSEKVVMGTLINELLD